MTAEDLSEFTWIDPDAVHLVGTSANGVPRPLLAKMAAELIDANDDLVKEFVGGLCGAEGCPVCKERLGVLSPDAVEKAKMRAKERHALSDSDFAFPKERKEPLNDAAHVRNAIARFGQVQGVSAEEKKEGARRIVARAKHLGIEVSEDSGVAEAAKETMEPGASASQTDDNIEGNGAATGPAPSDGGTPEHIGAEDEHPGASDGTGDTAPEKALPVDEALGQTRGLPATEGDATKEGADAKPGSPAWEHKDVALGERAEQLVSELTGVIRTFTEREKAEGGASKSLRRRARTARSLLQHPHLIRKEAEKMTDTSDALKVLGEYDAACRAEKKEAKKAKAKKAAKKAERKAAEAAEQAAKATGEPVVDSDVAKAMERAEAAEQIAKEARELAERVAAEPANRVPLNGAGVTAALRGPEAASVFKGLEAAVAEAEERMAKASTDWERSAAREEARLAHSHLTKAKLVAQASREFGRFGSAYSDELGPRTSRLIKADDRFLNALPEDTAVKGV